MPDESQRERLKTGVAGLDIILHGGLLEGGIYLIQGGPGSGKTILANQLCCAHVRRGGRALYLTLLPESIDRMLQQQRGFEFFDPRLMPDALHYVSGHAAFEAEGLSGVLELVRRELRVRRADLLVLDSPTRAQDAADAGLSIAEFTQKLEAHASLLGCTTLMLTRGFSAAETERVVVDALLVLRAPLFGARRDRRIEVAFVRGSDHVHGEHSYEITSAGMRVHPRLEAIPQSSAVQPQRAATRCAIAGLEPILGDEGLPAGSSTLVVGPPGAGKSVLALQFLAGCSSSERGLYLSFTHDAAAAVQWAKPLSLPLEAQLEEGTVEWLGRRPREELLDALAGKLLERMADPTLARVVIDGLDGFEQSTPDGARLLPFIGALLDALRARRITTLCTAPTTTASFPDVALAAPAGAVARLFDTWIGLSQSERVGGFARSFSLLKSPTRLEPACVEYSVEPAGVTLRLSRLHATTLGSEAPLDVAQPDGDDSAFLPKTSSSKPPARARSLRRKSP